MTATVQTLVSGNNKLSISIQGVFNTSDSTDVVAIDRSTLIGPDRKNVPTKIRIDEITWAITGFNYIKLEWDDGTDEHIEYLSSANYMDYRPDGGKIMSATPNDPADGDLLITESGGSAGGTYTIHIRCTLKE